jgi:hypothetical protein
VNRVVLPGSFSPNAAWHDLARGGRQLADSGTSLRHPCCRYTRWKVHAIGLAREPAQCGGQLAERGHLAVERWVSWSAIR